MNRGRIITLGIALIMILASGLILNNDATLNNVEAKSTRGNILYVGGSGPENYTEIQDAIDDANIGDTIFVYDDLSPYNEFLLINKKIDLIGENTDTTIIEPGGNGYAIRVNADGVNISGFTLFNNGYPLGQGIEVNSNNNNISGNTLSNTIYGIFLSEGTKNTTVNHNFFKHGLHSGIFSYHSNHNHFSGNKFDDNGVGIYFINSKNTSFIGNSFYNDGLWIEHSYQNIFINNTVNGKPLIYLENETNITIDVDAGQIILVNSSHIDIQNQNISNTSTGVILWCSNNCHVLNNNLSRNYYCCGLYSYGSHSNTITGNLVSYNPDGITFKATNNTKIQGNTICSNGLYGLNMYTRNSDNIISGNIIKNNQDTGVYLGNSSYNIITGNDVSDNGENGIVIVGSLSRNNTIANNYISSNEGNGFWLDIEANNNLISKNNIRANNHAGIKITESTANNIISENVIVSNKYGISILYGSDNNLIYHNTLNNIIQNANDTCTNNWYADYPTGGNYWSDYNGTDIYHGPNQNISGSDGIGDTPYSIQDGNNQDKYPLMNYMTAHTFTLFQGWNLISIPVENDWSAETLGQNITGCTIIIRFDAQNQSLLPHIVGVPWDDFPIEDGVSYFIFVTGNTTFTITGWMIESVLVWLYSGWNALGWFYHTPHYNITAEDMGIIPWCMLVTGFNAETQTFFTHIIDTPWDNFTITAGMGVFIYADIHPWYEPWPWTGGTILL